MIFRWFEKRKGQPLKTLLLAALLMLILVSIVTVFGDSGLLKAGQMKKRMEELRGEIASLERENERLLKELEALKSDPEEIERIAREDLQMVKPGEKVFRFIEEGGPAEERRGAIRE